MIIMDLSAYPGAQNSIPFTPKIIWMFWSQGLEKAPELVKVCYASWKEKNPDWMIHFLDEQTFRTFISIQQFEQKGMGIQALSDLIRLNLLGQYGGVWVDATCYCQIPLDNWLPQYSPSGFFGFERTNRSWRLDTWFIAANRDNYLISKLCEKVNSYWLDNPGLDRRPKISRFISAIIRSPAFTDFWFSYFVRKMLRIYPYMWASYLFTNLVSQDLYAQKMWSELPKLNAKIAHSLRHAGMLEPLTEEIKQEVDALQIPVYKLDWRIANNGIPEGSNLKYLLSSGKNFTTSQSDKGLA